MGMFSFQTSDCGSSIRVKGFGPSQTVYLLRPNGQTPVECTGYTGNGVFGGVDCLAWIAEQNAEFFGMDVLEMDLHQKRSVGGALLKQAKEPLPFPLKFSFNPAAVYEDLPAAILCPYQGMVEEESSC